MGVVQRLFGIVIDDKFNGHQMQPDELEGMRVTGLV